MDTKIAFGKALKQVRKAKKLTQEDFSEVSSRTYISSLERGIKSVTLEKLDQIAEVLGVNPLTILTLAYYYKSQQKEFADFMSSTKTEALMIQLLD